jgi:serine protease inhibitor
MVSGLPRALTANETRVAGAANQFTLALFRRLSAAQPETNVFVSPLSVSFSLGMAMNGASGTTLDQMRATLGFGQAQLSEINDGYRSLIALESGLDPTTTFTIANSMWYRSNFPVLQSFKDTLAHAFSAEVNASPFNASTIGTVNDWVKAKTNGKILTILDGIDSSNVMFLINAIYFKGTWREQFDPQRTMDQPFESPQGAGGTQTVPMMNKSRDSTALFAQTDNLTAGELLYGNGSFVMTLLIPQSGSVEQLAASLDSAKWNTTLAQLHRSEVMVSLPKFQLAYERSLADDLKALGMQVPFVAGQADFTNMSPLGTQLYISFVKHKTFVNVDETGTEAAAVTNTGVSVTSAPPCLCVNRPFILVIRERFSGTILFIAKIVRIPQ